MLNVIMMSVVASFKGSLTNLPINIRLVQALKRTSLLHSSRNANSEIVFNAAVQGSECDCMKTNFKNLKEFQTKFERNHGPVLQNFLQRLLK